MNRKILGCFKRALLAYNRRKGNLSMDSHGRLWLPQIAKNGGIGVELGVASGYYSSKILNNSSLSQLYSIDCWADHHNVKEYLNCCLLMRPLGDRSIVLRMYFDEALGLFPDNFFDFIYIDAYAGSGQDNGKILSNWWPKLKHGGIFSGHDYDPKWPQTIAAVDKFCKQFNYKPRTIPGVEVEHKHNNYSSWYLIK
jgi:hypothetical protein